MSRLFDTPVADIMGMMLTAFVLVWAFVLALFPIIYLYYLIKKWKKHR